MKISRDFWVIIKFTNHRRSLKLCKPDFKTSQKVAAEYYGISFWQNWQTESCINFSLLESPLGNLLRTEVHVFSDSVLCVGNKTMPLQTRHGRQSSLQNGPDHNHGQARYHGKTSAIPLAHIFRPHSDPNHERHSKHSKHS